MKIFCFLGNPGDKYKKTRHNAGFLLADFLQEKWDGSEWKEEKKFFGEVSSIQAPHTSTGSVTGREKIIFLKPNTFMNLSGKSLLALMQFYKISPEDICIFYDDKDLPFEIIRFRKKGSAGGHNGIKDIIRVLGTQEFNRIKIGVDTELRKKFSSTADYVLANFSAQELLDLEEKIFLEVEEKVLEEVL
jgi:PTH1 family peptidyl-tRNA hydrolase